MPGDATSSRRLTISAAGFARFAIRRTGCRSAMESSISSSPSRSSSMSWIPTRRSGSCRASFGRTASACTSSRRAIGSSSAMCSCRSLARSGHGGGWLCGPNSASAIEFQRGLGTRETVLRNERFLHDETNYLGRGGSSSHSASGSRKSLSWRRICWHAPRVRVGCWLQSPGSAAAPYSECHMRAVLTVKPRIGPASDLRSARRGWPAQEGANEVPMPTSELLGHHSGGAGRSRR